MGISFQTLRLLYDLAYYTSAVVLSVADPVSDLIVGCVYLTGDDTKFGIATIVVCIVPSILLSALSFQWIVYDYTLESVLKDLSSLDNYQIPQDYTHFFMRIPAPDKVPPKPTETIDNTIKLPVTVKNNEDVEMHPPETMDQVEIDSNIDIKHAGTKRRRPERDISQISVDAGLSKYPLIITGSSIDRKNVYKRTCKELKIEPVTPTCARVSFVQMIFHLIGLPGITRYGALFLKALSIHHKRKQLSEKYDKFVKEAASKGIKEVYFNRDLLELYHGRRDAALLRLVEGALEATPQLLLQLYIIVKHTKWDTNWFTYVSVVISFCSVVWSMTSYIYEHRAASYDKGSMSIISYIVSVLIKLCMCLSRITAILVAATYSGFVVLGVCIGHWITCLIYVCYAKTHFYGGLVWNEWFFKFISSITLVLTFMNIIEGRSRVRWLMYHLFTLLQNVGMLAFWYLKHYRDPLEPDWYAFMLISMVIGGTLIGSLLTLLYYKSLHPSENYVLDIKKIAPVLEQLKKKYELPRQSVFESAI